MFGMLTRIRQNHIRIETRGHESIAKENSVAHATSLHLILPPTSLTAVEEFRGGAIVQLPAYGSFTHSSVDCPPVKTNPVLKSYPLSDLLSESNDWGQWSITRMSEGMKPWRLMLHNRPGRWGQSRTAGRSSHLGSTAENSLSSQKNHLNFYSLADRLRVNSSSTQAV